MNYSIKTISVFERQAKKLKRKYPSIKSELVILVKELQENPTKGVSIGHNCFKIRLAIKSKGKGKSGGARIITNFLISDDTIYLLTIYDKSRKETITDKELLELLQFIPE